MNTLDVRQKYKLGVLHVTTFEVLNLQIFFQVMNVLSVQEFIREIIEKEHRMNSNTI